MIKLLYFRQLAKNRLGQVVVLDNGACGRVLQAGWLGMTIASAGSDFYFVPYSSVSYVVAGENMTKIFNALWEKNRADGTVTQTPPALSVVGARNVH